jgi:periplasmic protein TonB
MMMAQLADPDVDRAGSKELFGDLKARASPRRAAFAAPMSLVLHALALTSLIVVSLSRVPPALERASVRIPIYEPPPPPPPPLRKGPGLTDRPQRSPVDAPIPQTTTAFLAPVEDAIERAEPTPIEDRSELGGSPDGSALGTDEGMPGGEVGGDVGGVPGGTRGGVVGGTGDLPVPVTNPDRPPRLLRKVRPDYPQQAFVQKVQGTVMVEILIAADGRVVRTRVTQSIPALDAAAEAAVLQWVFAPAVKDGRPVATRAFAPVTFQLY